MAETFFCFLFFASVVHFLINQPEDPSRAVLTEPFCTEPQFSFLWTLMHSRFIVGRNNALLLSSSSRRLLSLPLAVAEGGAWCILPVLLLLTSYRSCFQTETVKSRVNGLFWCFSDRWVRPLGSWQLLAKCWTDFSKTVYPTGTWRESPPDTRCTCAEVSALWQLATATPLGTKVQKYKILTRYKMYLYWDFMSQYIFNIYLQVCCGKKKCVLEMQIIRWWNCEIWNLLCWNKNQLQMIDMIRNMI